MSDSPDDDEYPATDPVLDDLVVRYRALGDRWVTDMHTHDYTTAAGRRLVDQAEQWAKGWFALANLAEQLSGCVCTRPVVDVAAAVRLLAGGLTLPPGPGGSPGGR